MLPTVATSKCSASFMYSDEDRHHRVEAVALPQLGEKQHVQSGRVRGRLIDAVRIFTSRVAMP